MCPVGMPHGLLVFTLSTTVNVTQDREQHIVLVAKNNDPVFTTATEFVVDEPVLSMVSTDMHKNLQVFRYMRDDPLKLKCMADFHLGAVATKLVGSTPTVVWTTCAPVLTLGGCVADLLPPALVVSALHPVCDVGWYTGRRDWSSDATAGEGLQAVVHAADADDTRPPTGLWLEPSRIQVRGQGAVPVWSCASPTHCCAAMRWPQAD